jgi:hypothetical protein
LVFKRATKKESKLRLGLIGPAGSGKTYTALTVAKYFGGRVAVIDSEHGSASKYADLFDFDVLELKSFSPTDYVNAIRAAEQAGYDILIIDSLTHAWSGKNGALELVDKATARLKSGNSFAAWREVTPLHNQMVDAIIASKLHVIATLRSKTEYVMEEDSRGRKVPRKIGMAPIQRDGLEYEFDVVGDMDWENRLIVTKTRCPELAGAVVNKPGKEFAYTLKAWLGNDEATDCSSPPEPPKQTNTAPSKKDQTIHEQFIGDCLAIGMGPEMVIKAWVCNLMKVEEFKDIAEDYLLRLLNDGIRPRPQDALKNFNDYRNNELRAS